MSSTSSRQNDNGAAHFFASIGLGLAVAGGTLLYSGWRDNYKAKFIKDTPFTPPEEILAKLQTSDEPIYIKTSGITGSDEPITTEISQKPSCIYNKTEIGVWYSISKKDDPNNQWIQQNIVREAPWYITNSSKMAKIYVKSFNSYNPPLTEVHSHEELKGNFMLSLALGFLQIRYPYKYITKERVLAPNTEVLELGNMYKSRDKKIHTIAPDTGIFVPRNPGIITTQTEEEVIKGLTTSGKRKTLWGGFLTSAGVAALFGGISQM